jgi:hypothetical protein
VLPKLADDGLPQGWPQDHGIATLGDRRAHLGRDGACAAGRRGRRRAVAVARVAGPDGRLVVRGRRVGRFLFRRGQIVLPKGSGKSPVAAALSCCELAGPVVFDHFDPRRRAARSAGEPVSAGAAGRGVAGPDRQHDDAGARDAARRPRGAAHRRPGHRHHPRADPHGKLQPVTASAASREGARLTAAVLDETHLWTKTNGGHRLATTIRRNLGKMDGRSIETTNTWVAGELSVAEQTAKYADLVAEGDFEHLDEAILRWHPHANVDDLSDESRCAPASSSSTATTRG